MLLEKSSMDTIRQMHKGVLEQSKSETLLKAKLTKPKQSYLGHIWRRQGSLGKKEKLGENRKQQEKRKTKCEMD